MQSIIALEVLAAVQKCAMQGLSKAQYTLGLHYAQA